MVPNITPIMENQMEKNMENEIETGIILAYPWILANSSEDGCWATKVLSIVALVVFLGPKLYEARGFVVY